MKTLSIRQPWAWLIVNGYKDIENRTWKTHVRGRILVHAGKTFDRDGYEFIKDEFPDIPLPGIKDFERGGIVGETEIVNCVEESISPWFFGPVGFSLKNSRTLNFSPLKGQLGFFDVLHLEEGGACYE